MQKYETAVEFLEDDDFETQSLPDLSEVFDAGGLLSVKLKNYFPREGQKEMAKAVQDAFARVGAGADEHDRAEGGRHCELRVMRYELWVERCLVRYVLF